MKDLVKLALAGVAIYSAYRTGKYLVDELDSIDKKGLTVGGVITAAALGGLLLYRVNAAGDRTRDFLES